MAVEKRNIQKSIFLISLEIHVFLEKEEKYRYFWVKNCYSGAMTVMTVVVFFSSCRS